MSKYGLTLSVIDGKINLKAMNEKATIGDLSSAYTQLEIAKHQILNEILKSTNVNVKRKGKK